MSFEELHIVSSSTGDTAQHTICSTFFSYFPFPLKHDGMSNITLDVSAFFILRLRLLLFFYFVSDISVSSKKSTTTPAFKKD
jgi:hypothetical protein